MDKQNVSNGILCSLKKVGNLATCYNTEEPWRHYAKSKEASDRCQTLYDCTCMVYLEQSDSLERQKREWLCFMLGRWRQEWGEEFNAGGLVLQDEKSSGDKLHNAHTTVWPLKTGSDGKYVHCTAITNIVFCFFFLKRKRSLLSPHCFALSAEKIKALCLGLWTQPDGTLIFPQRWASASGLLQRGLRMLEKPFSSHLWGRHLWHTLF